MSIHNLTKEDLDFYNKFKHIEFLNGIDAHKIKKITNAQTYVVSMPDEEYKFLHETAVICFKGVLFAAWYNNSELELQGSTPIRFTRSFDNGTTWTHPETVVNDKSGKIIYCPPVFGIQDNKLYMFLNQMISADHMHSLDLYVYNEQLEIFEYLWSRPIPFKPNTNIYTLPDGKLILPGRIAELDQFPVTPAVMISDSGKIDDNWRLVKIQNDGKLTDDVELLHPEVSLIINKNKLYAFVRNCRRQVPIVYISEDNGESWSLPITHDIPFSNSKIYSGTLSDGKNYIIGNLAPGRSKLAVFISKPHTMEFNKGFVIQNSYSGELDLEGTWCYPSAYEENGKLYIIYTYSDKDNHRGAVITVVDINAI